MKQWIALLLMLCLLAAPALGDADDEIWYKPGQEIEPDPREVLAEQWMLAADPDAAEAENIYVHPSNESDGAWVFCCEDVGLYFAGEFWYLDGENAYSLGKGKQFFEWSLLHTTPEVFCCSIGKPDVRRANASILVDGKPYALNDTEKFASLRARHGCMYGWVDGYDSAFLCVDNNELCEIEATEITMEQFMTLKGAQEVLDVLWQHAPGVQVDSLLYRATGMVTLNVTGKVYGTTGPHHMYAWPSEDGSLTVELSFGDQLALHDGIGSSTRSTGLRVIRSEFPE